MIGCWSKVSATLRACGFTSGGRDHLSPLFFVFVLRALRGLIWWFSRVDLHWRGKWGEMSASFSSSMLLMIDDVPLSHKQIILSSLKKRRERRRWGGGGGWKRKEKEGRKTVMPLLLSSFPFAFFFFSRLASSSIALVLHAVQSLDPKQENRFFNTELFTAQLRAEF